MSNESLPFEIIPQGGVTTPQGFIAGAVSTGIKTYGQEPLYDLGVILSNSHCTIAGAFTRNQVKGSSVIHNQNLLKNGHGGRAIFANSGNANVATGEQGFIDTANIAQLTAKKFNLEPDDVWIASTGVIGRILPMHQIQSGIENLNLEDHGGHSFAQAIMTTDTRSKEIAIRFQVGQQNFYIGACAKGSGMIHPNLATMLAFITTDIAVNSEWLQQVLEKTVNKTFNMLDIDMDTSTSDTVLMLANGAAENIPIDESVEARNKLRSEMKSMGYLEVINYPVLNDIEYEAVTNANETPIELQNPINQKNKYMRPNLRSGLIDNLTKNSSKYSDIESWKFFELGRTYTSVISDKFKLPTQSYSLGIIASGSSESSNWSHGSSELNFYTFKGHIERLREIREIIESKYMYRN